MEGVHKHPGSPRPRLGGLGMYVTSGERVPGFQQNSERVRESSQKPTSGLPATPTSFTLNSRPHSLINRNPPWTCIWSDRTGP